jgi:pimeloyl-ACP methyl ester carboxylesterase
MATARALVTYWADGYDWRTCEAKLNALPQFRTEIDGLDIHFIHVKSPHEGALPLVVTHGWPGPVIEMLEVVGPLTDRPAFGGRAEDAFDLVIPSLPGYGATVLPRSPRRLPANSRHDRPPGKGIVPGGRYRVGTTSRRVPLCRRHR